MIKTLSFRSFIVSCYSLIQILSNIVSSDELSIAWHQYFQKQICNFQVLVNTCPLFQTCTALFEVFCFYLLTVITCLAWMRMKSCSMFLRILVRVVHFTDRNWNYTSVYSTFLWNENFILNQSSNTNMLFLKQFAKMIVQSNYLKIDQI